MPTQSRTNKLKSIASKRQQGIIVLEDIYDPHNAQAVLRSCDAFGFQTIYCIFEQQKPFNPRKIGKVTSASANKWLDFKVFRSTEECINLLHLDNYSTYATVLDKHSQSIFDIQFSDSKTALLFGNEHRGLSEKAVKLTKHKLYIPMWGFVQSLNLSVTAAICMFELHRQRYVSNNDFSLPSEKADQLFQSYLERS